MLNIIKYKGTYRNLIDNFDNDFFIPCYKQSNEYMRASGFFSLDSLLLCFNGLFEFAQKNGKMRLICSPKLDEEDVKKILNGSKMAKDLAIEKLLYEIESYDNPDGIENLKLDIICNLIASGFIEIRIAFMDDGIFHEKFGIFKDESGNMVYFNGSPNSTYSGSKINSESLDTKLSWAGAQTDIEESVAYFEDLWNGKFPKVKILEFKDACQNKLFEKFKQSETFDEASKKLVDKLCIKPKTIKKLYDYQEKAIEEFVKNDCKHFYEMATGTGKTFTAIKTIETCFKKSGKVFAIVLVPQTDLQTQWIAEIQEQLNCKVFGLGGTFDNSDDEYVRSLIEYKNDGGLIVVVAVYDTFFGKYFDKFGNVENLFIVADEAHNLTPGQCDKLPEAATMRLGLSATLERWYEEDVKKIKDYFLKEGEKPFFYGIKDAISRGFLSHYRYYPIFVELEDDEFAQYQAKTASLAKEESKDFPDQEKIRRLCNERSLILKKSGAKIGKLQEMVASQEFNFNNAVVYCGAGEDEEESIIDKCTKILNETDLYTTSQFTSKTPDRDEVLAKFELGYYSTLIAIRCFDEGVDVPKLDKIYVMASDGSTRQTVQRRGRVLRICKETNKQMAYIYDMIVLPPDYVKNGVGVKSIIHNELLRMNEYLSECDNKDENKAKLLEILERYEFTEDLLNVESEPTD